MKKIMIRLCSVVFSVFSVPLWLVLLFAAEPLPGRSRSPTTGDLAAKMVDGMHKYLDRELAASPRSASSLEAGRPRRGVREVVEPNRERLRKYARRRRRAGAAAAGVRRRAGRRRRWSPRRSGTRSTRSAGRCCRAWTPRGCCSSRRAKAVANVVAIPRRGPDAGAARRPGRRSAGESQFARRLAENGCRVLVPTLIDRKDDALRQPEAEPARPTSRTASSSTAWPTRWAARSSGTRCRRCSPRWTGSRASKPDSRRSA